MRRREFSTLLGRAATASTVWPLPLRAQQKATPVIGYLSISTPGPSAPSVAALRQGLSSTSRSSNRGLIRGISSLMSRSSTRLPFGPNPLGGREPVPIVASRATFDIGRQLIPL